MGWRSTQELNSETFKCGYCGNRVASQTGFVQFCPDRGGQIGKIYLCPHCDSPTYWNYGRGSRLPDELPGESVKSLPENVAAIYAEARECVGTSAYTAAAMLCRKLLMYIAVEKGAEKGKSFIGYVQFLSDEGYVPPNGKHWVDHIRKQGNEANHDLKPTPPENAKELISFVEMLLKFVYEFPAKIPAPEESSEEQKERLRKLFGEIIKPS